MLTVKSLALPDVKLLTPKQHFDDRGWLAEIFNEREMQKHGLPGSFVQENQSLSLRKGTVRGLHAQKPPYAQGKLIRVLRGKIHDVALDVRPVSSTFGKHVGITLSADSLDCLYIPQGFLHGFSTLEDNTVVAYKVTEHFTPGQEVGVMWNDPVLHIDWQVDPTHAILSDKDKTLSPFADMPHLDW